MAAGPHAGIYNGPHYDFYDASIKGNAYYMDNFDFKPGAVHYDGFLYPGVSMLYDIFSNRVVVLLPDHFTTIALINDRVSYFDYLDHHFVHISTDTLSGNSAGMRSGYYDQIYKGNTEVLVRRSKSIQAALAGTDRHFVPAVSYFLKREGAFYRITGISALLDVLKDKKKELQTYVKSLKMKFRKNPEEMMVKVSSYYDQLNH